MLADNPAIGQARPDIAPRLRYFPTRNYLILYREMNGGVEIVRVVHGARYLPDIRI
jgi:toxin ParE1/3/4